MKGDVGMHNAKNHRNKSLHSKIIVQSCVTPPYIIQVQGPGLRMIVLLSCYEDLVPMIFRIVAYGANYRYVPIIDIAIPRFTRSAQAH